MKVFNTLSRLTRTSLLILFGAALLFWSSLTSLLPILPLYIQSIGGSSTQIGIVIGAFAVGLLLSRETLSKLADQRSRKTVLMLGVCVAAIAPIGYLLVPSVPALAVIRGLHGISIAAFATGYLALVVDLSPPQNRGEIIGYMSLVNPLGLAIGPALGGALYGIGGYVPVFFSAAAFALLGLWGTLQVIETKSVVENPQRSIEKDQFWGLLVTPPLRTPTLVMFLVGLAFGAISAFVPLFMKEVGVTLNVGWFYTAAAIASFSVRLTTGRLSDRLGRGLFISTSLVLYAIAMVILVFAHNNTSFLLAGLIEGFGFGLMIPMTAAMMADRAQPHERGRFFGLCMGGFDFGVAVAGPSIGVLAEWLNYRSVFGLAAVVVFVSFFIFITQSGKDISHSLRYSFGLGKDTYAIADPSHP